jgi:hypothetical protein
MDDVLDLSLASGPYQNDTGLIEPGKPRIHCDPGITESLDEFPSTAR